MVVKLAVPLVAEDCVSPRTKPTTVPDSNGTEAPYAMLAEFAVYVKIAGLMVRVPFAAVKS